MKILIADDHEVVRQGLKQILAEAFGPLTTGEAGTAAEALEQVDREAWDLVLLDISMPGRNGMEALADLKRACPGLPVLVLSMFSEEEYAVRALRAGASGYLSKQSLGQELVVAVKKVLDGGRYVSPGQAELLAANLDPHAPTPPHERLSVREYEVMKLLATGRSVKEIAAELSLGDKTVFTYRARLLEKLGLKSDVEIARYALRHRLVE